MSYSNRQQTDVEQEDKQKEEIYQKDQQKKKEKLKQIDEIEIIKIDDPKLYNLPKLIKYDFRDANIEEELKKIENKERLNLVQQNMEYLLNNLEKWDIDDFKSWEFNLPRSFFEIYEKPKITFRSQTAPQYEKKKIGNLKKEQLIQIKSTGTFDVPSDLYPIPYTWKLNPYIIKGQVAIKQQHQKDISISFQVIYNEKNIKKRLNQSLKHGIKIFPNILNLLIGLKRLNSVDLEAVFKTINDNRQLDFIEQYSSNDYIKKQFYEYLLCSDLAKKPNQTKQEFQQLLQQTIQLKTDTLKDFDYNFNIKWKTQEKIIIKTLNQDLDDESFAKELRNKKKEVYFQLLKDSTILTGKVEQHAFELLNAIYIINIESASYRQVIKAKTQEITKKLQEDHKIKSLVSSWLNENVDSLLTPFEKEQQAIYQEKVKIQFSQNQFVTSLSIFNHFLEFQKNYASLFEAEKTNYIETKLKALRKFETIIRYFPIFYKKVLIKEKYQKYDYKINDYINLDQHWTLKQYEVYYVETDKVFWRQRLIFQRYFVWTNNAAVNLYFNAIHAHYGLKALFKLENFKTSLTIDPATGELEPDGTTVTTYYNSIKNTMNGIKHSRQAFENQPDTGFFGKNFSRFFNYIECYIFRVLILILLIIFQPIVILLNSTLSLLLATTTFLWIPFALFLRFLINTLILDFDSPYRKSAYSHYNKNPLLPILYYSFSFIRSFLIASVFNLVYMTIISPLIALIVLIFAYVRLFFAKISEEIMYKIVCFLGREPISDTKIARKIAGIGISRQFYYSMSQEDIFFLFQSELEKMEIYEYSEILKEKIDQPYVKTQQINKDLFQIFGGNGVEQRMLQKSLSFLNQQLNKQIENRKKKLPTYEYSFLQSVGFTEEEISKFYPYTQQLIETFFTQRNLLQKMYTVHLSNLNEEERNIDALTKMLWIKIFNKSSILEPIEDIELRFSLEREENTSSQTLRKVIEGQINLSKYNPNIKEKYRKPVANLQEITFINEVVQNIQLINNPHSSMLMTTFNQYQILLNIQIKREENQQKKDKNV